MGKEKVIFFGLLLTKVVSAINLPNKTRRLSWKMKMKRE